MENQNNSLEERKLNLAKALKAERDNMVAIGHTDGKDHNLAITYLETGKYDKKLDLFDYDMLQGVVEDLETVMKDYDV